MYGAAAQTSQNISDRKGYLLWEKKTEMPEREDMSAGTVRSVPRKFGPVGRIRMKKKEMSKYRTRSRNISAGTVRLVPGTAVFSPPEGMRYSP